MFGNLSGSGAITIEVIFASTVSAAAALLLAAGLVRPADAQDMLPQPGHPKGIEQQFSPYAGREFPTRVLWGDTHLHTAVSVDAGTMNRVGQEDTYRFARGEEITTTHGLRARLSRPLNFLVISDHAEMYGLMPQLLKGDREIVSQPKGKEWYRELSSGDTNRVFATAMDIVSSLSKKKPPLRADKIVKDAWKRALVAFRQAMFEGSWKSYENVHLT